MRDMSSQVSTPNALHTNIAKTEYARFRQWLRDFFALHPDPYGVHAIRVFNAAFRAGFTTRAGQYLSLAASDGTLQKVRFNRLFLNF
jgi:hypothetical protein